MVMGKLQIRHSQRATAYANLAKKLTVESKRRVKPWMGAKSRAYKKNQRLDTDRVRPSFARGMHETEPVQHGEEQLHERDDEEWW